MKKLIFCFVILLAVSCKSTDNKITLIEKEKLGDRNLIQTVTNAFYLNDTTILNPEDIWVVDSLLWIKTSSKSDFLRAYSTKSGSLINSFGFIGRGPGEYINPLVYCNSHDFIIYDKLRYSELDYNELVTNKDYAPEINRVTDGLVAVNFLCRISGNQLLYNSTDSDFQYSIINTTNEEIENFKNFPTIKGLDLGSDFIANSNIFRNSMVCDGKNLFIAYLRYPIIDIVNLEDKHTTRIQYPLDSSHNKVTVVDQLNAVIDNPYYYHVASYLTDNYFYVLYSGDSQENLESLQSDLEIHKYSLNGDLLSRIKLDRPIFKFAISADDKMGYGLAVDNDYNIMLVNFNIEE